MKNIFLVFLLLFLSNALSAQKNSVEFKKMIYADPELEINTDLTIMFLKFDIAPLLLEKDNNRVLGFIGDDYQD